MIAMFEAEHTTTSALGIWSVIVVATACLVFWLSMMFVASQDPGGARRRRRVAAKAGLGRGHEPRAIPETGTAGTAGSRLDVPGQRGGEPVLTTPGIRILPSQRAAEADQPSTADAGPADRP